MYAAHRAAGGVTSLYRQIGIGCERLVRTVLGDTFSLPEEATRWSYTVAEPSSGQRVVSLDAGLPLDRIPDSGHRRRVEAWLTRCADSLDIDRRLVASLRTIVFEIRQGYKSKDSKRQLADIANAAAAYTQCCFPCLLVLSRQIDEEVASRYRANRWLVLTGATGLDDPLRSTYDFMAQIVGFDLAAFFPGMPIPSVPKSMVSSVPFSRLDRRTDARSAWPRSPLSQVSGSVRTTPTVSTTGSLAMDGCG